MTEEDDRLVSVASADNLHGMTQPQRLQERKLNDPNNSSSSSSNDNNNNNNNRNDVSTCFSSVIPLNADSCSPRSAA